MNKYYLFLLCAILILFITGCDLFEPGLGDKPDLKHPFLFVTSHTGGDYLSGTITLQGNFEEDKKTSRIQISFDGGATFVDASLDNKKDTWSCTVDTTSYTDGEKDVIFIITDSSGKDTTKNMFLRIDNTPPLIVVNVPLIYGGDASYYGTVVLKGEVKDISGIKSVRITLQDLTEVVADGINSWSYYFDSVFYIPSQGSYAFSITAIDNAGNTSNKFYHYADVKEANGGTAMSIEDLYKIYSGEVTNPSMEDFLDNNGKTSISYNFDQDLDKPTIEVYNPSEDSIPEENVVSGNARLSGKVIDENGVKPGSIEIYILKNGESIPEVDWEGVTETNPGTESVSWSYILGGLSDGEYTLRLRAEDQNDNSRETDPPIGFIVDSGAPSISVDQPSQGAYINGNFTISGTANDLQGIKQVEVSLDDGDTYELASLVGENWSYNVTNPTEGSMLIKVKAIENTIEEKKAYYNLQAIIDRTLPEITFLNPQYTSTVNGLVLIKGVSSDNTQITDVKLQIGEDPAQITMTNKYNWEYEIDSQSYADDAYAEPEPGSPGVWRLYVIAQVTDRAGNVRTKDDYYFLIDNDMDKPTVTILSPQEDANIGGSTLVTGTAFDDDSLYGVYMSIDLDNDGYYTHQYDLNEDSDTGYLVETITDLPVGNVSDMFEDETKWYPVEDGTISWKQTLNSDGELYHVTGGHNGDITVRVVAVDTKDGGMTPSIKGNTRVLSFRFDDTIPGFEGLSHNSGSYVKGEFHLTGTVTDDTRVDKLDISCDGGLNWSSVATPYLATYDFDIAINTETINSGEFDDSSGILYLRLRAEDNTGFRKLQLIDLNVDNSYPENTAYTGASSDIYGSSVYALMQGEATDAGAVSGIKEVHVYFVRGTSVYNPKSFNSTTTIGTYDFGDGNGDVPYTSNTTYKIVIDDKNEFGNDTGPNGDNDGYPESLSLSGSTMNWWATFTSTNIPDGQIDVHYVVFDNAMNGHHYSFAGWIKNYKPQINGITVGSDVDVSNTVDEDEKGMYSNTIYSSGNRFKARSRFYMEVDAADTGGTVPGIATYEFFHESDSLQSGASAVLNISLSAYSHQDTYFTCEITDNDNIVVTTMIVWVTFDKDDTEDPVITIDDLDTDDDGDPSEHIIDGHIELPENSLYNNSPPDADVSGIIKITGSASDNHRINEIRLTLNGTGTSLVIAEWVDNMLQPADLDTDTFRDDENFQILTQSLTAADGHEITWLYTWDTSTVNNTAGINIRATFDAEDPYANSASSYCDYDVVPYITGLLRGAPGLTPENTTRSKHGKVPVQQGEETLYIYGYNLRMTGTYGVNSWVRVYNSDESDYDEVAGSKVSANGSFTTLTLADLGEVTHSGFLRVQVNNVEAVNYFNDNLILSNKEDDGNGLSASLWTDDRYLHVWEVGSSFGSGNDSYNAEYTSMSIDSSGDLYGVWMDRAAGRIYYAQPEQSRTSIFYCYDPPEFTDIHITSGDNLTIAYLANNFPGTWTCAENNDLGSIAVWTDDPTPPQQSSVGYNNNYYQFEKICHNQMILQFQRPKVVRSGDNIHVAYYDIQSNSLKYGYADINPVPNENEITPWINIDGGTDGDTQIVSDTTPARSSSSGEYLSIDVDEQGYPVIMYYDISVQSLRLARATSTTPNTASDWQRQTVFQVSDSNRLYSGRYITMKIDSTTGEIYAACYNTASGDLIYLHASDADLSDYDFDESETIDSIGAVGSWTDITINSTSQSISYLNTSMIGTLSGLKLSYYDTEKSNWEYEIVPLMTPIYEARTNIEYRRGSLDWVYAIGYKGTNFDVVYLKDEE